MQKVKLHLFQILIIIAFIFFLNFYFKAKNYELTYNLNNVEITESYSKDNKGYYFTFTYQNQQLDYFLPYKYQPKRHLIKDLKIEEKDSNVCLKPTSSLSLIPLCTNMQTNLYYKLVDNTDSQVKALKTYNDINIYNPNYTYLIWDYDGFYYLNKDDLKKVTLFKNDYYTLNLATLTKDYLIIPDLDQEYSYNKMHVLNLKNGTVKTYNLDRNIYYDSYYPGVIKNKVYIVDKKERLMYEFNAKNGKLTKIKPKLYNIHNWNNTNIENLILNEPKFTYSNNFNYSLENNNIYLKYNDHDLKTLIAENVKYIVKTTDQDIFYLKDTSLYHFNLNTGEEKLLDYFEWNFNYQNLIYIN